MKNTNKLFFTSILFIILVFIISLNIKNIDNTIKINDIIHDAVPPVLEKYDYYLDIAYILIGCIFVLYIIYIDRPILLIDFLIIYFIALLILKILSLCTTLPDCSKKCHIKHNGVYKIFGQCNAYIMSGHFTALLLMLYLIHPYISNQLLIFFIIVAALYAFFIVSVRNHYTIDIIISIFVVDVLYRRIFLNYLV